MDLKKIFSQFNVTGQCKRYGLSLWQCPQFLFLIMGVIIIGTAVITYAIGTRYVEDPALIALIILLLTAILFIIAFIIIQGFERLAEANRMKSEFISVASHQLRSPLSNLRWAIELLMSGRLGNIEKKQTEYFKILKENSGRMMELISDLLTVSRIEQRTLPLKKQEFSLENLIKDLILEFKPFIQSSNIEVKLKVEENLPKILADPSQIRLVAENLLDNAIRYIKDKGEVEIKLGKKGKNLYFEITDSGVGIPKKDKKYIFQKFFRSENILKCQTQGTGLGLYIAKAIIGKSGGKIGFSSQEEVGSTFWFTLPIKLSN
ncbi:MAG: HAMP domain-containing histidine kinase [Candidatus Pacebacteria bacterium]|nr:HAMP domain-containing histidine kinase [Candidatus Paceibacterota bacterium]